MQNNKTPGPDGLTAEFYKHFFPILSPLYLKVVSEAFEGNSFSKSFTESFIKLIPKPNTDKKQMQNYRPISLLNCDYKILAKALSNKLSPFLGQLINEDQQCSVKNRSILKHAHFLRDLIQYTHDKDIESSLLSLDQTKAFDRVSHIFLHDVLKECNLGKYFTTWIKILYKNPESKLLINHALTEPIPISRSVRQGCPLSPLLYVLVLEPVLEKIRQDPLIKGTHIPGVGEKKLLAYADDTVFFPTSMSSIQNIFKTFESYGTISGSEINVRKSHIMGIGKWKNQSDFPFSLIQTNNIKIYGFQFPSTPSDTNAEMWSKIVLKIKNVLDMFMYKSATIFGRSVIVNTLVITKLLYVANVFYPPKHTMKAINKLIRKYIFRNTLSNIQDKTLMQLKQRRGGRVYHYRISQ
jgi:hypothetical protein